MELFPHCIFKFLDPNVLKKKRQVKERCLDLLLTLSESDVGRKNIAMKLDQTRCESIHEWITPTENHVNNVPNSY